MDGVVAEPSNNLETLKQPKIATIDALAVERDSQGLRGVFKTLGQMNE